MTIPTLLKMAWIRWKRIAHIIGTFQARLILAVLYVVLLPMFALIARLTSDPMQRRSTSTPRWLDRPVGAPRLEDGRRQFS